MGGNIISVHMSYFFYYFSTIKPDLYRLYYRCIGLKLMQHLQRLCHGGIFDWSLSFGSVLSVTERVRFEYIYDYENQFNGEAKHEH